MMGDRAKDYIGLAQDVLLNHPLSISTDVRLVSTCQLLCIQCKLGPNRLPKWLTVLQIRYTSAWVSVKMKSVATNT